MIDSPEKFIEYRIVFAERKLNELELIERVDFDGFESCESQNAISMDLLIVENEPGFQHVNVAIRGISFWKCLARVIGGIKLERSACDGFEVALIDFER